MKFTNNKMDLDNIKIKNHPHSSANKNTIENRLTLMKSFLSHGMVSIDTLSNKHGDTVNYESGICVSELFFVWLCRHCMRGLYCLQWGVMLNRSLVAIIQRHLSHNPVSYYWRIKAREYIWRHTLEDHWKTRVYILAQHLDLGINIQKVPSVDIAISHSINFSVNGLRTRG